MNLHVRDDDRSAEPIERARRNHPTQLRSTERAGSPPLQPARCPAAETAQARRRPRGVTRRSRRCTAAVELLVSYWQGETTRLSITKYTKITLTPQSWVGGSEQAVRCCCASEDRKKAVSFTTPVCHLEGRLLRWFLSSAGTDVFAHILLVRTETAKKAAQPQSRLASRSCAHAIAAGTR